MRLGESRIRPPSFSEKAVNSSAFSALRTGYDDSLTSTMASFSVGAASAGAGWPTSSDETHAAISADCASPCVAVWATAARCGCEGRRMIAVSVVSRRAVQRARGAQMGLVPTKWRR